MNAVEVTHVQLEC